LIGSGKARPHECRVFGTFDGDAGITGAEKVVLQGDRFIVLSGTIQVTPGNTRYLFGVLKDRVSKIVEDLA
jgi:hypothetical protein